MRETNDFWLDATPNGWKEIVADTDAMLRFIDPDYKIAQIKEKFGFLRYYIYSEKTGVEQQIMLAITAKAERRSENHCMECGKFGKLRDDRYWIVTLCDDCNVKRNEEIAKREKSLKMMRNLSRELGEYE